MGSTIGYQDDRTFGRKFVDGRRMRQLKIVAIDHVADSDCNARELCNNGGRGAIVRSVATMADVALWRWSTWRSKFFYLLFI